MDAYRTFDILIKPVGSTCNLQCEYCYYLEKNKMFHPSSRIMSDQMLETVIKEVLKAHGENAVVRFNWHGGEPLLAGLEFYKKAIALQNKFGRDRKIINAIQTNGTTLDNDVCRFLSENSFSVGISIDGTKYLHNKYRCNSFDHVLSGIGLLQKYCIEYALLCTINNNNSKHPKEVYEFLRQQGDFIQFLPVVEEMPAGDHIRYGQRFATPPGTMSSYVKSTLLDFGVTAEDFGNFMCTVYSIWKKVDEGRIHIQYFDAIEEKIKSKTCPVCTMDLVCGHSACIDLDGKVYSCDRFQYEEYCIGDIQTDSLAVILERNRNFGMYKTLNLPQECLKCEYVKLCAGGCPKDRRILNEDNRLKNILCEGYKKLFKTVLEKYKR